MQSSSLAVRDQIEVPDTYGVTEPFDDHRALVQSQRAMTRVELEQEAMNLPQAERLELAEALVESIVPFALDSEEQAKADRAIESYRADPHDVVPAEKVHLNASRLHDKA